MIHPLKPLEIFRQIGCDKITISYPVELVYQRQSFSNPECRLIVRHKNRSSIYKNFSRVGFLMNGDAECPDNPWRLRNVAEAVEIPFAMTEEEARKKIKEIDNPDEKWRIPLSLYLARLGLEQAAEDLIEKKTPLKRWPMRLNELKTLAKYIPKGE